MSSELLTDLIKALDAPQSKFAHYGRYYRAENPLQFVSPESQAAIGSRLSRLVVNVPRILVNSLAERLRITGMSCADADVWAEFLRSDMDQQAGIVHRTALLYGQSFVLTWGDGTRPIATVESPLNVQVLTDPATGEITAGVKRWRDDRAGEMHCMVYLPHEIQHWRATTASASASAFSLVEVLPNPLNAVPVTRFLNADLLGDGVSEIADITGLSDALSKISTDLLTASEFLAKPRRYVTGQELVEVPVLNPDGTPKIENGTPVTETVSPIPETDRFMHAESENAKFGQLPGSPLDGYKNAADLILSEISAVSSLPPHYLGILHDNPTSEGSLKASEAGLTAKASAKMAAFGRSWERVGRLLAAVQTGRDPADIECRVKWGDPGSRSESQLADSVQKLYGSGPVISRAEALRRLGYSDDQVTAIVAELLAEQKREAYAKADPGLMEYNSQFSENAQFRKTINETSGTEAA